MQVRAQVAQDAGSRWRRAPASAGARNFRVRRHLPLLGPRRRGELAKINARCAERAPQPPLRAPAAPPTQRTDPAPSRHLAPPTRRLAHLASTSPAFALVCAQEVKLALLPRPGSRSARRGGATAAAPPVRAGRPLGCPGGARSGDGGGVGARRRHLQGGQRWARKGHRTLVVFSYRPATCQRSVVTAAHTCR